MPSSGDGPASEDVPSQKRRLKRRADKVAEPEAAATADVAPKKTKRPKASADTSTEAPASGTRKKKLRTNDVDAPTTAGTKKKKLRCSLDTVAEPAESAAVPFLAAGAKQKKGRKAETLTKGQLKNLRKKRQKQEAKAAAKAAESAKAAADAPAQEASRKKAKTKADDDVLADVPGKLGELVRDLNDLKSKGGTLSDRLNPAHWCHDKDLKKQWKTFSKKERALVVEADKRRAKGLEKMVVKHPFEVTTDDHCETAIEAYRDVAPILSLLAKNLGKKPKQLKIYDPYFCAGATVEHLNEVGFADVYNKCEDFYAVIEEKRVPEHDVLVTNPPYSEDHVEKLLKFCKANGKPFFLLMPNYFCAKPYYEDALGGKAVAEKMLYLYPNKRYVYWTPKGLRSKDKMQAHSGAAGTRTSPFPSFWYCSPSPAIGGRDLLKWWQSGAGGAPAARCARLCRREKLPDGVAPGSAAST